MKAYKGFNDDLTCRGFQYEEGKSYHEDEAIMCESGFHACLNPIYCLDFYYPNHAAVYHEVEIDGVTNGPSPQTKVCGTDITIGKRLSVEEMCEAHFEYVKDHTNNSSGTRNAYKEPIVLAEDAATSVGRDCAVDIRGVVSGYNHNAFKISNYSVASGRDYNSFQGKNYDIIASGASCLISAKEFNTVACVDENMVNVGNRNTITSNDRCSVEAGDFNVIATRLCSHVKAGDFNTIAGDKFSTLEAGKNSIIVGRGRCSGGPSSVVVARGYGVRVKGGVGSILVIVEETPTWSDYCEIADYGVGVVDGVNIKPDTWYKLHDGEFVEVVERKTEPDETITIPNTNGTVVVDNEGDDDDG
jgi:hypothetical protein